MNWTFKACNILDEPGDVLVCSANVMLNLSGGVGAELLGRYGTAMQKELHALIANRTPIAANQGEIFCYRGQNIPYQAILHAVAVDGWYHSTPQIVTGILERALKMAAGFAAKKVLLTALATGFGDLSLVEFADGVKSLIALEIEPLEEVCICVMEDYRIDQIAERIFPTTGR